MLRVCLVAQGGTPREYFYLVLKDAKALYHRGVLKGRVCGLRTGTKVTASAARRKRVVALAGIDFQASVVHFDLNSAVVTGRSSAGGVTQSVLVACLPGNARVSAFYGLPGELSE